MEHADATTPDSEHFSVGSGRGSLDELIETVVERAVMRALGPYLHRLSEPEPIVYTISQAAQALQVSPDTVARLVRRGTLPKVPHIDGRVLIPRHAVDAMGDVEAS